MLVATGISLHNLRPPRPPANTVTITTDSGTESREKLDQTLKLSEIKGIPEADAQRLVDRLDLANLGRCLIFMSLMTVCKVDCFVPTSHLVADAELNSWVTRLSNARSSVTSHFATFLVILGEQSVNRYLRDREGSAVDRSRVAGRS